MPWFMSGPWVPKYSGEGEPSKFLDWRTQIEAFIRAQGLNDEQRVDFLLSVLEGNEGWRCWQRLIEIRM